jgi:hypothetical protein
MNPLTSLGVLNRLQASVACLDTGGLDVTATLLAREGIRLALEGAATNNIEVMAGTVPSPAPYQMCSVVINLLKTNPIALAYKTQMELNTVIGRVVVRPDADPLSPYDLFNCSIMGVREQSYAGDDPGWAVTLQGTYYINAELYEG